MKEIENSLKDLWIYESERQLFDVLYKLNWRLRDEMLHRKKDDYRTSEFIDKNDIEIQRDDFIKTLDDKVLKSVELLVNEIRYILFDGRDT